MHDFNLFILLFDSIGGIGIGYSNSIGRNWRCSGEDVSNLQFSSTGRGHIIYEHIDKRYTEYTIFQVRFDDGGGEEDGPVRVIYQEEK